jgi:hypothetical protein
MHATDDISAGSEVFASSFNQPLFADIAASLDDAVLSGNLDVLNRLLTRWRDTPALYFVAQTPEMLADGLHYEERIAQYGIVATRERNPHDLFNALVWLRHTQIKRAMNARQVADIARVGRKQRTRGQCALTHFDEAGAIVWVASRELLAAWDAHDWRRLFGTHAAEWGANIAVTIVGHALYEYALVHQTMPVAKALAVAVDSREIAERSGGGASIPCRAEAEHSIAAEIAAGRVLADPQELRPLPLAGIPGWQAGAQPDDFFDTTPCFRPLRTGRRYPAPIVLANPLNRQAEHAIA